MLERSCFHLLQYQRSHLSSQPSGFRFSPITSIRPEPASISERIGETGLSGNTVIWILAVLHEFERDQILDG
jgi:hypothetical protein